MPSNARKLPLHASGALKERALAWWTARMPSRVTHVYVKGDGYLRFEWEDDQEDGHYHLALEQLYADSAATA